jgi:hypothetical protein
MADIHPERLALWTKEGRVPERLEEPVTEVHQEPKSHPGIIAKAAARARVNHRKAIKKAAPVNRREPKLSEAQEIRENRPETKLKNQVHPVNPPDRKAPR